MVQAFAFVALRTGTRATILNLVTAGLMLMIATSLRTEGELTLLGNFPVPFFLAMTSDTVSRPSSDCRRRHPSPAQLIHPPFLYA